MILIRIIIIVFLFASSQFLLAQDTEQFSEIYSAPMLFNPALCGSAGTSRIFFNNRTSSYLPFYFWKKPVYNFSYDQPVNKSGHAFGMNILYANYAHESFSFDLKQVKLSIIYALPINLYKDKYFLRQGIMPVFVQEKLYGEKNFHVNISLSYIFYSNLPSKNYFFGGEVRNIFKQKFFSNISNYSLYNFHTGVVLKNEKNNRFIPQLFYSFQKDSYEENQIDWWIKLGLSFYLKRVAFGGYYTISDPYISTYRIYGSYSLKMFKLTYSYNALITHFLSPYDGTDGGHEVSLQFNFRKKNAISNFTFFEFLSPVLTLENSQ